jgi:hypothetical protein
MHIIVQWQKPVQLTRGGRVIVDEKRLPESILAKPSVYFFSRKYGRYFPPFYIGETKNTRSRLKSHLQSKKIYAVLIGVAADDNQIRNGTRFFHFGYLKGGPGQNNEKCRKIIQKYMIRHAAEHDVPILNHQLKKVRTHSLRFHGGPKARGAYKSNALVEAR